MGVLWLLPVLENMRQGRAVSLREVQCGGRARQARPGPGRAVRPPDPTQGRDGGAVLARGLSPGSAHVATPILARGALVSGVHAVARPGAYPADRRGGGWGGL